MLTRAKFGFAMDRISPLLSFMRTETLSVEAGSTEVVSPDPDDTAFIACAVVAEADYLVTGNRRHFPAPAYGPAQVVNAADLLRRLDAAG